LLHLSPATSKLCEPKLFIFPNQTGIVLLFFIQFTVQDRILSTTEDALHMLHGSSTQQQAVGPFFPKQKEKKQNKQKQTLQQHLLPHGWLVGWLLLLGWVMISCHANSLMLSLSTSLSSSLFLFLGFLFSYN
jgi:hypothetical protein